MLRKLFLLSICVVLCRLNAMAGDILQSDVTRGNYVFDIVRYYYIDGQQTEEAIITSLAKGYEPTGELTIPGTVTVDGKAYPVTGIGKYGNKRGVYDETQTLLAAPVFQGLKGITSVVISNELQYLSANEFIDCPNIKEFKVKSNNKIYYAANGILFKYYEDSSYPEIKYNLVRYPAGKAAVKYTVPSDTYYILEAAFAGNKTLKTIVISGPQKFEPLWQLYNKSITNVDTSQSLWYDRTRSKDGFLFYNAPWFNELYLKGVCPGVKLDTYSVPSEVTHIEKGAFCNTSIGTVVLTGKYADDFTLPDYMFRNSDIEKISIPASLSTQIGEGAFRDCKKLTYVSVKQLSGGTVDILDNAFYNCSKLEKIVFVSGIKSVKIGHHAFNRCAALASFGIASGTSISYMGNFAFANCKALTSFPLGVVKEMQDQVYWEDAGSQFMASGLTSVNWPSSLTNIPVGCFKDCTSLTTINLKESTNWVGSNAFNNTGIETLNTSGVSNAGSGAFANCKKLRKVVIPANTAKPDFIRAFTFEISGTQLIINTPLKQAGSSEETMRFRNVDVYISVNDPDDIFLPYKSNPDADRNDWYRSDWKSVNVPAHTVKHYQEFSKKTPKEMFSYYNDPDRKTATVISLDPIVSITGVTIEGVAATKNGNVWSAPKATLKSKKQMNVTIDYTVNGAKMQTKYTEVYSSADISDIRMNAAEAVTITLSDRTVNFDADTNWRVYDLQGSSVASGSGRNADLQQLPSGIYIIRAGGSSLKAKLH